MANVWGVVIDGLLFPVWDSCVQNYLSFYDLNGDGQLDKTDAEKAELAYHTISGYSICGIDSHMDEESLLDTARLYRMAGEASRIVNELDGIKHKSEKTGFLSVTSSRKIYSPDAWQEALKAVEGSPDKYEETIEGAASIFRKIGKRHLRLHIIDDVQIGGDDNARTIFVAELSNILPEWRGIFTYITVRMAEVVTLAQGVRFICEGGDCGEYDRLVLVRIGLGFALCLREGSGSVPGLFCP